MENTPYHTENMPEEKPSNTPPAGNGLLVTLDEPIRRGQSTIGEITLRHPTAGELRGITLHALADLDVMALQKVLPRITSPALTEPEIAGMSPADLMQLGVKVAAFLLPKADRATVFPGE